MSLCINSHRNGWTQTTVLAYSLVAKIVKLCAEMQFLGNFGAVPLRVPQWSFCGSSRSLYAQFGYRVWGAAIQCISINKWVKALVIFHVGNAMLFIVNADIGCRFEVPRSSLYMKLDAANVTWLLTEDKKIVS
ncbi:hypothetical protein VNO77_22949 [Canavalia gladiata]|uniref:Uncharacterized protein n=1 Tax=Canavalia gladiata TaxID=3824 RepID=A0AAN9L3J9_CANGL